MAKIKRRNKKLLTIVLIVFILLLVASIGGNVFIYLESEKVNKKISKLKATYETKNNDLASINSNVDTYKKDIDKITNIDDNINKTKDDLFSNIKLLEDKIIAGESDKKIIYITFDDGPYYSTYKVLETLKKYDVKATFFIIGQNVNKCYDNRSADCSEVIKATAAAGHTIANHTYSHGIFKGLYSSTNSFITNITKQEELIRGYTGLTTNIARFPGGSSTAGRLKNSIIEELRKKNYGWVDWTAQDGDGGSLSSKDQAWRIFVNSINEDIEVLLLHDYNAYTIALLPNMIEYLKEKGYLILPLSYKSNMVNK